MTEAEARAKMDELVSQHGLAFTHNPGGGEFWHPTFGRCQIGMQNDLDDLARLQGWLAQHGEKPCA